MIIQEKNKYKYLSLTTRSRKGRKSWNGIPAFLKKFEPEISLYNHSFYSICGHIAGIIVFAIILHFFSNAFHHIDKVKDIEFIIKNSSGHRAKLSRINSSIAAQHNYTTVAPQNLNNKVHDTHSVKESHSSIIPDDFSIPMPKLRPLSGSTGQSSGKRTSGVSESSSFGSSSGDIGSTEGSTNGSGSVNGNGFDKNATRKVVSAYDISPYVNELKRNIRLNWRPAKGHEGKNVELFLRIAKDGRLIILNVKRTSEIGEVDNAALNAVRKTQPLNPLPSKYTKSFLDIVFTFNPSTSSVGSRY